MAERLGQSGVEVVGMYPVDAPEPCHLIELVIRAGSAFNVGQITQEEAGVPRENRQVAWDAKILDLSGESIVADAWSLPEPDILPAGEARLAFFLHYLDASKPLQTPLGPLHLPEPSALPSRLRAVEYEQP